jgi:hypothetical protein
MRRNSRNRRNFGPGGMHPKDVAIEIFGETCAISSLDILEHAGRVGVRDNNIEGEPVLFASLREAFVVVDSGPDTQPADEPQATGILHPRRLTHVHGIGFIPNADAEASTALSQSSTR